MKPSEKISYIDGKIENGKVIDWNKIHKAFLKLRIPNEYYQVDIPFDKSNIFVIFSERNTGKTTNIILMALLAYKMYGVKIEWIRQKSEMIKPTNVSSMFNTITKFDYIGKITNGKYHYVYYYRKEMFLCNYADTDKGRPKDIDDSPFIRFNSIDDMQNIKSNYTSPDGDIIVLDEFQSTTNRSNEFEDFFHIVSTIKRDRLSTKIFFLGNTITPYNYYFREMDITKYILKMSPNSKLLITNDRGMHIYLEWFSILDRDTKKSESKRINNIQYYGFNGLNSINGGNWDIKMYPHITRELDNNKVVLCNFWLEFQMFTLNLKLCEEKTLGLFVYVRPCSEKSIEQAKENGDIIFSDKFPYAPNIIYGVGKNFQSFNRFWALSDMGLFLYSTNDVGALVEEYKKMFK